MPRRSMANDLRDIAPVVDWADACFAKQGFGSALRFDIQVCLEEALANLILHGQCHDGKKAIQVSIDLRDKSAVISIFDRCTPFDVVLAPLPSAPTLQDTPPGGNGLRLLRMLSTQMTYRTDQDVNELQLIFEPEAPRLPNSDCSAANA